jgi:hypothetical protein
MSEAKHKQKKNQKCIFINNEAVGAIPAGSRVDGGVARQQQLGDFNVTARGGVV